MRTVKLKAAGGIPSAHVVIGHAQFGKFTINLFGTDKKFIRQVGAGATPQSDTQFFNIDAPAALDGKFLGWDTVTAPFTTSPGQFFSITMEIRQDDKVIAAFTDDGTFTGVKPKITRAESVVFEVV